MPRDKEIGYSFWASKVMLDTAGFTAVEKGYYLDLLVLSESKRVFSDADVRRILGNRYTRYWEKLHSVLVDCQGGYCIGWVHDSIEAKERYNLSRSHTRVKEQFKKRFNK